MLFQLLLDLHFSKSLPSSSPSANHLYAPLPPCVFGPCVDSLSCASALQGYAYLERGLHRALTPMSRASGSQSGFESPSEDSPSDSS